MLVKLVFMAQITLFLQEIRAVDVLQHCILGALKEGHGKQVYIDDHFCISHNEHKACFG